MSDNGDAEEDDDDRGVEHAVLPAKARLPLPVALGAGHFVGSVALARRTGARDSPGVVGPGHLRCGCMCSGGLYIDGAKQTVSATGTGTGLLTQPQYVYPGTRSAAGSEFNGSIRGWRLVRGVNMAKATP